MSKPTVKQMLFNLLTHFETLQFENFSLKTLIITSRDSHLKQTWESDLIRFSDDEELRKKQHERFVPLYAEIEALTDDSAVLELLAKISLAGKAN